MGCGLKGKDINETPAWVMFTAYALAFEPARQDILGFLGPTWFRRGSGSGSGHAEASLPRKSSGKSINANDERFALAA